MVVLKYTVAYLIFISLSLLILLIIPEIKLILNINVQELTGESFELCPIVPRTGII
jgi:hypothetical protein